MRFCAYGFKFSRGHTSVDDFLDKGDFRRKILHWFCLLACDTLSICVRDWKIGLFWRNSDFSVEILAEEDYKAKNSKIQYAFLAKGMPYLA